MIGLTRRQSDTLDFIRSYRDANGVMPTCAEIAVGIGLQSRGRVSTILDGLIERGAVRRISRKARALELVEPDSMQAVLLNKEIFGLVRAYATAEHIGVDAAASELLRQSLGAA